MWILPSLAASSGVCRPDRDNVGGVPARPLVLGAEVRIAVVLLSLLQELGQRRDIQII